MRGLSWNEREEISQKVLLASSLPKKRGIGGKGKRRRLPVRPSYASSNR